MFYTGRKKTRFTQRFLSVYAVVGLLVIVFIFGVYAGSKNKTFVKIGQPSAGGEITNKNSAPPYLLEDVDFDLFWKVWNITKDQYLEQPVFDTKLFYGALQGMVASLEDPYSVFLDPEITKQFTDELAGTFEGIGAEIGIKKGQLVVIAPLPGTPAESAGLRAGDYILKIEKLETSGMPLDVAVSNIRGPKGEKITLTVFRKDWKEPREIAIVRDKINVQSVTVEEMDNGIAKIKLSYFNENTPELFEKAVQEIMLKNSKGIILDLRNDPGGFLEVAVKVAGEWIEAGKTVVIQEFQGGKHDNYNAQGLARLKGIPTVVLVNGGSASASEIVAGALKDYGLATIVGETSFGKGSVQTLEQLRGGSSIKLTIAHWLTPKGLQINSQGIKPDQEVKLTTEDYDNNKDPQLQKAVELLTAKPN